MNRVKGQIEEVGGQAGEMRQKQKQLGHLNRDEIEDEEEQVPDFRATFMCEESRNDKLLNRKKEFELVESPEEL